MRHFVVFSAFALVAACGDPMAGVPRLSQVDLAQDAPVLGAVSDPATETAGQGGLFSRLLAGQTAKPVPQARQQALGKDGPIADPETLNEEKAAPVIAAAVSSDAENPTPPKRRGLFARFGATPADSGETTSEIAPGTILPYGQIARICHLPKKLMGTQVARYPERNPRHKLYDSAPGNTAPHSFYLTGFDDGCARQFTASLAVFGSVGMHEQLRYGLPAQLQPYSDTDKAYEKLKSGICGVPRKKPCGARVGRLERDTVFLTIYEHYGGNSRWDNLLLHAGRVLAKDSKGI